MANGKFNQHGRRICKFSIPNGFIYTKSGQWVGHEYGRDKGTERQIKNAQPHEFINNGGCIMTFEGSSTKVFWNMTGNAGDIIASYIDGVWNEGKNIVESLSFSE